MRLVGGFERGPCADADATELERSGALISSVWQQPVVVSEEAMQLSGDFVGDHAVAGLDLALALSTPDTRYWAEVMEGTVGGLSVFGVSSPEQLAALGRQPVLVLTDEGSQRAFEAHATAQARWGARLTTMLVDRRQLVDDPARMAGFLVVSVMLGLVDGWRSGCLHLRRKGGGAAGTVIFCRGKIAWASATRSRLSLLHLIHDVTKIWTEQLRQALARSIELKKSFRDTLLEAEMLSEAQYEEALKACVAGVVGELLKVEQPHLLWSANVRMAPHGVAFDGAEVLLSSMFGS